MSKLDPDEAALLSSVEAGEWRAVPAVRQEMQRHREIAAAAFREDQRSNIRLSSRASEEG